MSAGPSRKPPAERSRIAAKTLGASKRGGHSHSTVPSGATSAPVWQSRQEAVVGDRRERRVRPRCGRRTAWGRVPAGARPAGPWRRRAAGGPHARGALRECGSRPRRHRIGRVWIAPPPDTGTPHSRRPHARSILRPMRTNTFAARAGRWSAANRKKAIFGWLAFVIVAVAIGAAVGTKTPANDNSYVGDSGRGDKLVTDHYPDSAGESVLIQGRQRPDLPRRRRPRRGRPDGQGGLRFQDRPERRLALRQGQPRPDQPRRQVRPRELRGQGQRRRGEEARSTRSRPPSSRSAPTIPGCASASSATPARARRSTKSFSDDFGKAEKLSVPITIADPDPRVRHARGRRHPDPAGADRGLRHARHPGSDQPRISISTRTSAQSCC